MENKIGLKVSIKYSRGVSSLNKWIMGILLLLSCSAPDKDLSFEELKELKEFQHIFPFLEIDSSWDFTFIFNDDEIVSFEAEKKDSTLKYNFVKLSKVRSENPGFPLPTISYCYSIDYLLYRWEDDEKGTYVEYNHKLDTVFHYYFEKEKQWEGDPYFIRGKYNYQYYYNRLTPGQMRYYEENKDSLFRIEGEDLPDLPELDKD